jgi:hypothetical protein
VSPGRTASGTALLNGSMAFTMEPFASHTRPSAWNPGCPFTKPRSRTTSIAVPSVVQSAGTVPVRWNHVVPQGRLHSSPTVKGRNSCVTASA